MAADHAQSQVNPAIAQFQTLFAAVRTGLYILDLVDVRTAHASASHVWDRWNDWIVAASALGCQHNGNVTSRPHDASA